MRSAHCNALSTGRSLQHELFTMGDESIDRSKTVTERGSARHRIKFNFGWILPPSLSCNPEQLDSSKAGRTRAGRYRGMDGIVTLLDAHFQSDLAADSGWPRLSRVQFGPEDQIHNICPLLLRCFWQHTQRHRRGDDFANSTSLPRDELQIYTWPDASIREITNLIQGVVPAARRRNGRLSFAFVYPDSQGKQVLRQVASVSATRQGPDDGKTLKELKFQTGDFLDVAIF